MIVRLCLICALIFICTGCGQKKESTLSDIKSKKDLLEYAKTEQAQSDLHEGQKLVQNFKTTLPQKSSEELIDMFFLDTMVPEGPEYYLQRDGNIAIKEELRSRGESVKEVLLLHKNDHRPIFTGLNGPPDTISSVCREILEDYSTYTSQGSSFREKQIQVSQINIPLEESYIIPESKYKIDFQETFDNNLIELFVNDAQIFADWATTEPSSGLAKSIELDKEGQYILLVVIMPEENERWQCTINLSKGQYLGIQKREGKILIEQSQNPFIYD